MLKIISEIRKYKSDNNLSMKTTLDKFSVNCKIDLSEIIEDLKNVGNVVEFDFGN